MARDKELVPDADPEPRRSQGLEEPVGAGRRDRPAELDHAARRTARSSSTSTAAHVFDLNVEYFVGMPSWVAAGDPPYGIWMTHTPQGSVNDNLSGVGSAVHKKYSYCGDSIHLYTHCGTHIDTLNHLGFYGEVLERLDGGQGPRQPHLEQGRPREVPAGDRARRSCSTSRG